MWWQCQSPGAVPPSPLASQAALLSLAIFWFGLHQSKCPCSDFYLPSAHFHFESPVLISGAAHSRNSHTAPAEPQEWVHCAHHPQPAHPAKNLQQHFTNCTPQTPFESSVIGLEMLLDRKRGQNWPLKGAVCSALQLGCTPRERSRRRVGQDRQQQFQSIFSVLSDALRCSPRSWSSLPCTIPLTTFFPSMDFPSSC